MGRPKELKYLQVAVMVIAAVAYLGMKNFSCAKSSCEPETKGYRYVERVIDGDTLKLSGNERVRLIGIDTPEVHTSDKLLRDSKKSGRDVKAIQSLGREASQFTKGLCNNKMVRLEYDVKKRDRYGRLLAYVYLEDGTFVNAKILEEGYGQIMTVPPNVKYADRFRDLEKKAREGGRGLWKE